MGVLRNPATFACLWLGAGCNALFGVEEPHPIESGLAGGEGGKVDLPQRGGGPSISPEPQAGSGGESGSGGETSRPGGGEAGTQESPATGGASGSGGDSNPPSATGGIPRDTGGSPGAATAGAGGSEPTSTGGAAGAAGAGGSSSCGSNWRRCADADTLEICEDGSLQEEGCPHGCDDDACLPECSPPSIECSASGDAERVCGSDGRFGQSAPCIHETCVVGTGCTGVCAPKEVRCNTETGDAEKCVAGDWDVSDVCADDERCSVEGGVSLCIDNDPRSVGPDQSLPQSVWINVTPAVLRAYPLPEDPEHVAATVLQLGVIAAGQPANLRLALYEDNGAGYPGALRARTNTITVNGEETRTSDIVPAAEQWDPEKRYWIAVVFATGGTPQLRCRSDDENPGGLLVSHSFDSFPTTFPSGALNDAGIECNLFARVRTNTP